MRDTLRGRSTERGVTALLNWSERELMRPEHSWNQESDTHVFRGFRRDRRRAACEVLIGISLFVMGILSSWTPSLRIVSDGLLVIGAVLVADGCSFVTEKIVLDKKQLKSMRLFRARSTPLETIVAINMVLGHRRGQKIWVPSVALNDGTHILLGAVGSPQELESSQHEVQEVVRTLQSIVGVGGRIVA